MTRKPKETKTCDPFILHKVDQPSTSQRYGIPFYGADRCKHDRDRQIKQSMTPITRTLICTYSKRSAEPAFLSRSLASADVMALIGVDIVHSCSAQMPAHLFFSVRGSSLQADLLRVMQRGHTALRYATCSAMPSFRLVC